MGFAFFFAFADLVFELDGHTDDVLELHLFGNRRSCGFERLTFEVRALVVVMTIEHCEFLDLVFGEFSEESREAG